jgi:hypothetical protein
MTNGVLPVKAKETALEPGAALASSNAWRSVPGPESARLLAMITCGTTRIWNEHAFVLPDASVATQRTTVSPTGRTEPDGGEQTMAGSRSQLSLAEGAAKLTAAWPEPGGSSTTAKPAGHAMRGGTASITVTVNEH